MNLFSHNKIQSDELAAAILGNHPRHVLSQQQRLQVINKRLHSAGG